MHLGGAGGGDGIEARIQLRQPPRLQRQHPLRDALRRNKETLRLND